MEGHRLRVGALAWGSSVLSSGSRDKSILQRDIRCQEDHVSKLAGHKSEVCGLKWSYDNRELASGGNDNRVCVLLLYLHFLTALTWFYKCFLLAAFCMEPTFNTTGFEI